MSTQIVVITGAAGRIGRAVSPLLARPGRRLRLLDRELPAAPRHGDGITASITDRAALAEAFAGADAVVHLAGIATEGPWREILETNIDGTQAVLDAAHTAGVRRILLASSIHVVGYATPAEAGAAEVLVPRPDTFYGVSKAAAEALGSVYADRFGMSVTSARICTFGEDAGDGRALAQWLSPGDATRLIEAAVARRDPGHRIVWGVSRNAPAWFPLGPGEEMGYHPEDDAVARTRERDGVEPDMPERESPLAASFIAADRPLGG